MKNHVLDTVLLDLKSIELFSEVGVEESIMSFDAERVSHSIFNELILSDEWVNVRLEAQGALSVLLNDKYQSQYQEWNMVVEFARQFCRDEICFNLSSLSDLSHNAEVIDNVVGDLILIVVEKYFVKRVGLKPGFFSWLYAVYKKGHIPCGYKCNDAPDFRRGNGVLSYF